MEDTAAPAQNGGLVQQQRQVGPRGLINRVEYLRVIEQALHRLGYADVAAQLESASGIQMQPSEVSQFQHHVVNGEWEAAQRLLPALAGGAGVLQQATFLVLQQKYLEALEEGQLGAALACLRNEMAPLGVNTAQLHSLAALLMCPANLEGPSRGEWLGGGRAGRVAVLHRLQALLPPSLMLPQARLEVLVEQALLAQVSRCQYHNAMDAHLSLLTDYQAGIECLPTRLLQVADAHTDEVWHVSFSNCGTMLATASKDKTAIIWSLRLGQLPPAAGAARPGSQGLGGGLGQLGRGSGEGEAAAQLLPHQVPARAFEAKGGAGQAGGRGVGDAGQGGAQGGPQQPAALGLGAAAGQLHAQGQVPLVPIHVLQGHKEAVAFVCWSPDNRLLLTCSDDTLNLFDVASGQLLHRFHSHRESVTSCAWLPDSKRFLSGSIDKTILMTDTDGNELQRWRRPYRIQDMVISPDGNFIIIASSERQLHVFRLSDQRDVALQETAPITSIALAPSPPSSLASLGNHPWPYCGGFGAGTSWHPGMPAGAGGMGAEAAGRYLLVNLQGHTVHLWDLGEMTQPYSPGSVTAGFDPMDEVPETHIHEYRVNDGKPGRYVLRSGFGGSGSNFVVHGSEDCKVYVWHRDSEELLLQLEGHSGTVNSVSWNPTHPHLLASASDDKTVRLWVSAAAAAARPRRQAY